MMATPAAVSWRDDLEQHCAFGRRQRRGRLVHDEDAGIERQRLGDLDDLLLADAQAARLALRVDRDAEPGKQAAVAAFSMARLSTTTPANFGSRPRKMLAATESS